MNARERWGSATPQNARRDKSLYRFGRRYFRASLTRAYQGHDYRMQAVRVAARLCSSLDYLSICAIINGWGDAEEDSR